MKRFVKIIAALLAVFWMFCGFSGRQSSDESYPVYALIYENGKKNVPTTAFLLREDTLISRYTYLMTDSRSSHLLNEGYTAKLLGPDGSEEAVFLGTDGYFSFYYVPEFSKLPAQTRAASIQSPLVMMTPELDGGKFAGWKKEVYNIDKWQQADAGLLVSDNDLPESLASGALVYQGDGAVGCATQDSTGKLAFATFVDLDFPREYALERAQQKPADPNALPGAWSNTSFGRPGIYPFVLEAAVHDCRRFTLDYTLCSKLRGEGTFEILVRTLEGSWQSLDTFEMPSAKVSVTIQPEAPLSFDAVVVISSAPGHYSHDASLAIRDVVTNK